MALNAKEYQEKIRKTVECGYQTLLLGVGFKLKIFEHLGPGGESEPKSSLDIAKLACLKEDYVREFLNFMVVSDFVECDRSGKTYWLSPGAKETFTDMKTSPSLRDLKLASVAPVFATVSDQICDCFKLDGPGGLPYSAYPTIHDTIEFLGDPKNISTAVGQFIQTVPGLKEQLEHGITCLDIGCGNGLVSLTLASHFPNSQFYGVDICEGPINTATARAREKSLTNVNFLAMDASKLADDWSSMFDYVTAFDCLHDMARPDLALLEIRRILKLGARFSAVDIYAKSNVYENKGDPKAIFFYAVSLFHCMPVSLYFPEGLGLGAMWGVEKATAILKDAGFVDMEILGAPTSDKIEPATGKSKVPYSVHYLCKKTA